MDREERVQEQFHLTVAMDAFDCAPTTPIECEYMAYIINCFNIEDRREVKRWER